MNGLFLYQLKHAFIYTRQDLFTWLFMQTGLHQWLLNNTTGFLVFDIAFYSMPLILLITNYYKKSVAPIIAVTMLIINWSYIQCYTLYPINSIESYVAWLLFPVVFIPKKEKTFLSLYEGLRYFLLFFFASAAIWKFVQGGIFYGNEMSGILLYQHNQLLTNSPGYWQAAFILYLIQHPGLSYCIYLSLTILELLFIIGFFTKKYDRMLVMAFILFLIGDYIIMRIPYFEITALFIPLVLKYADTTNQNQAVEKL
ncbi:hypothetical protein BH11BAC6_BH11BAC6_07630 [soil metagenome]